MKFHTYLIGLAALALGVVFSTSPVLAESEVVDVAVGAQYGTTHVDVSPGRVDAFAHSFAATFGGQHTAVRSDRDPQPPAAC